MNGLYDMQTQNIAHGNIKPSSIWISNKDEVKYFNFSIGSRYSAFNENVKITDLINETDTLMPSDLKMYDRTCLTNVLKVLWTDSKDEHLQALLGELQNPQVDIKQILKNYCVQFES